MSFYMKIIKIPCLNVAHDCTSFFFLVDIRLSNGGEDVRDVAAEEVSGVEGVFEFTNDSPFGVLNSLLLCSNLIPFTVDGILSPSILVSVVFIPTIPMEEHALPEARIVSIECLNNGI